MVCGECLYIRTCHRAIASLYITHDEADMGLFASNMIKAFFFFVCVLLSAWYGSGDRAEAEVVVALLVYGGRVGEPEVDNPPGRRDPGATNPPGSGHPPTKYTKKTRSTWSLVNNISSSMGKVQQNIIKG